MSQYRFLTLSLLFLVPAILFYAVRPDMRRLLRLTVAASLPFALTEFLFYPTYWEPKTLFDLVPRIGFGIEDFLFVAGLGGITSGVYPLLTDRTPVVPRPDVRTLVRRSLSIAVPALAAIVATVALSIPMIYAAPVIMTVAAAGIVIARPHLLTVSLGGAAGTIAVYGLLSLVYKSIFPNVFTLDWNTELFLNAFVLGIPVEELIYATGSGAVGSVVIVFVSGGHFERRSRPGAR